MRRILTSAAAACLALGLSVFAAPGVAGAASGRHLCNGYPTPNGSVPMTVKGGVGSGTVTWWDNGDPAVSSFTVIAVPQRLVLGQQPRRLSKTVTVGAGCRNISLTLTGLWHRVGYVFWLDSVVTDPEFPKSRTESTIGTSYLVFTK